MARAMGCQIFAKRRVGLPVHASVRQKGAMRLLARFRGQGTDSRDSRPERNSAKRPLLASIASSPKSFRSRGRRAVGAISLNVLENPRDVGLVGGERGI